MNDNSKRYTMLKLFITLIVFVILSVSIFHIDTIKAASKDDAADSSIISSDIISDEPVTNNPVLLGDTKLTSNEIYEIPTSITSKWGKNLKCVIEYVDVRRKEGGQVVTYSIPSMTVYSTKQGKSELSNAQAMRDYIQELNSNTNTYTDARKWLESHKPLKDGKDMGMGSKVYRIGFPKYSDGKNQIYLTDNSGSTFEGCKDLYGINLSNLNTSECTNMSHMFEGCYNLREIIYGHEKVLNDHGGEDVQANCYFDTSKVTDMNSMYKDCYSLKVANLPGSFKTSNVTNMGSMFEDCVNLCDISFGSDINPVDESVCFDTSKVTNMSKMFKNCRHVGRPKELISPENQKSGDLQTLIMPENFTVENCKDLSGMFMCDNTTGIKYLDESELDDTKTYVKHKSYLKEIVKANAFEKDNPVDYEPFEFNAPNAENISEMFSGCESLGATTENSHPGKVPVLKAGANNNLTQGHSVYKECYALGSKGTDDSDRSELDVDGINVSYIGDLHSFFEGCSNLTKIKGIEKFDTKSAENLSSLFKDCYNLKSLDLQNINSSECLNVESMFENCSEMTELKINVDNFKLNKVTNLKKMFKDCTKITSLPTMYFGCENAESADEMFSGCRYLQKLDLFYFNPENLKSMNEMFAGLVDINTYGIDIRNFNNKSVPDENKKDVFKHVAYEGVTTYFHGTMYIGPGFTFNSNAGQDDVPYECNNPLIFTDKLEEEHPTLVTGNIVQSSNFTKTDLAHREDLKTTDKVTVWRLSQVIEVKDSENPGFIKYIQFVKDDGHIAKIVNNAPIVNTDVLEDDLKKVGMPDHKNLQFAKWENLFYYRGENNYPENSFPATNRLVYQIVKKYNAKVEFIDSIGGAQLMNPVEVPYGAEIDDLGYYLNINGKYVPEANLPHHPMKKFIGYKIQGLDDNQFNQLFPLGIFCDNKIGICDLIKPDTGRDSVVFVAQYEDIPMTGLDIFSSSAGKVVVGLVACVAGYSLVRKFDY